MLARFDVYANIRGSVWLIIEKSAYSSWPLSPRFAQVPILCYASGSLIFYSSFFWYFNFWIFRYPGFSSLCFFLLIGSFGVLDCSSWKNQNPVISSLQHFGLFEPSSETKQIQCSHPVSVMCIGSKLVCLTITIILWRLTKATSKFIRFSVIMIVLIRCYLNPLCSL